MTGVPIVNPDAVAVTDTAIMRAVNHRSWPYNLDSMWKEGADILKSLFQPEFRRWACGAALVVGVAGLFTPDSWFTRLRLAPLTESQRTIVAAVALVGLFGLCVEVAAWLRLRIMSFRLRRFRAARLHHLTPEEKQILCGYVLVDQRTQYFHVEDGVVMGLVGEKIIYQSSTMGSHRRGFAFNIQPWAWDYLRKHPELIAGDVLTDGDGRIAPYGDRL